LARPRGPRAPGLWPQSGPLIARISEPSSRTPQCSYFIPHARLGSRNHPRHDALLLAGALRAGGAASGVYFSAGVRRLPGGASPSDPHVRRVQPSSSSAARSATARMRVVDRPPQVTRGPPSPSYHAWHRSRVGGGASGSPRSWTMETYAAQFSSRTPARAICVLQGARRTPPRLVAWACATRRPARGARAVVFYPPTWPMPAGHRQRVAQFETRPRPRIPYV